LFEDRRDAGRQLAERLAERLAVVRGSAEAHPGLIVLGIPRGGVIVAAEVARGLHAPLDVFITHKLGAPGNRELAMGAVASDGTVLLNRTILDNYPISQRYIDQERAAQMREIRRREALYRRERPPLALANQEALVVDDGVATGATTLTALRALRNQHVARLILAVPVAPHAIARELARECDEAVFLATPEPFQSVGRFYRQFDQVTDEQVINALDEIASL
jgi:predicted phosphoribosyltransferase